uniref:Uncharacterized protein n=1 Tax=Nelumbo nucifera TaxID=4432 RepID=A0A822XQR2_NELNU|nr:TPA_asm: hypothetical protein HUJ06_022538 [Nelumbo nucifera]
MVSSLINFHLVLYVQYHFSDDCNEVISLTYLQNTWNDMQV